MKKETQPLSDFATAHRYTEIAHHYDADWRGALTPKLQEQANHFASLVGEPPKKILDAGCGNGKIGIYLEKLGYSVFHLDLSRGMLEKAIQNARNQGVDIYPVQANMRSLCFANESLDAIWSMASLVHLDEHGKSEAISEFSRVLARGGILYISVQNLLHKKHIQRVWQSHFSWLGYDENNNYYQTKKTKQEKRNSALIPNLKQGYAYLDDRHWYFPTKPELVSLLSHYGFAIIDSNSFLAKRIDLTAIKQ